MIKAARELNRIVKESEEYERYQHAMKAVKEDAELYHSMNQFRRRNYELQSYEDGVNRYQEIRDLCHEYEEVLRDPLVNEFLLAEQILVSKLQEVYNIIVDGLEFDYDYME